MSVRDFWITILFALVILLSILVLFSISIVIFGLDATIPFIPLGSIIAITAGTGVAAYAAYKNVQINMRNKRSDVVMHCNNRYDELYKYKIQISSQTPSDPAAIEAYFARYWGLKSDQFDYWLSGWVDVETFASWFYSTRMAFQENKTIGHFLISATSVDSSPAAMIAPSESTTETSVRPDFRFSDGWDRVGKPDNVNVNSLFVNFINEIRSMGESRNGQYRALLVVIGKYEKKAKEWSKLLDRGITVKDLIKSIDKWE